MIASAITGEMSWWDLFWWTGGSSYEHQWWHGTGWMFATMLGVVITFLGAWLVFRGGRRAESRLVQRECER